MVTTCTDQEYSLGIALPLACFLFLKLCSAADIFRTYLWPPAKRKHSHKRQNRNAQTYINFWNVLKFLVLKSTLRTLTVYGNPVSNGFLVMRFGKYRVGTKRLPLKFEECRTFISFVSSLPFFFFFICFGTYWWQNVFTKRWTTLPCVLWQIPGLSWLFLQIPYPWSLRPTWSISSLTIPLKR